MTAEKDEHAESRRLKCQFAGFLAAPQFLPEGQAYMAFVPDAIKESERIDFGTFPEGMRIGHRAEVFFLGAIKAADRYRILDSHIQIVEDGRTLGELDFLIQERDTMKVIHVELAYKFYLFDPKVEGEFAHQCIGANRRDSWGAKREKLYEKQFPLLYHPAVARLPIMSGLNPAGISQKLCMKMQLFLPYGTPLGSIPEAYRPLVSGIWLRLPEFKGDEFADHLFALPPKTDWFLDPHDCCTEQILSWMPRDEVITQIEIWHARKMSPLLFSKSPAGVLSRLFAVWW